MLSATFFLSLIIFYLSRFFSCNFVSSGHPEHRRRISSAAGDPLLRFATFRMTRFELKKFIKFSSYFLLAQFFIGTVVFILSTNGPIAPAAKPIFSENYLITILVFYGLAISLWACTLARTKHGLCHEAADKLFPARFQPWIGSSADAIAVFSTWIWMGTILATLLILGVLLAQKLMAWPELYSFRGVALLCLAWYWLRYNKERCQAQIEAFLQKYQRGESWQYWLGFRIAQLILFLLLVTGLGILLNNIAPESRSLGVFFNPTWIVAWPYFICSLALLSIPWLGQRLHTTGQPLLYGLGSTTLFTVIWLGIFKARTYIACYINSDYFLEFIYGLLFVGLAAGIIFILRGVSSKGELLLKPGFQSRLWLKTAQAAPQYGHEILQNLLSILLLHLLLGWWGVLFLLMPLAFMVLYLLLCCVLVPFFDRSYST